MAGSLRGELPIQRQSDHMLACLLSPIFKLHVQVIASAEETLDG